MEKRPTLLPSGAHANRKASFHATFTLAAFYNDTQDSRKDAKAQKVHTLQTKLTQRARRTQSKAKVGTMEFC